MLFVILDRRQLFPPATYKPNTSTPQLPASSNAWQQRMVRAGLAASTILAIVTEKSMKCLDYFPSWLQFPMQHIEYQMTLFAISFYLGTSAVRYSVNGITRKQQIRIIAIQPSHYQGGYCGHVVQSNRRDQPIRWRIDFLKVPKASSAIVF